MADVRCFDDLDLFGRETVNELEDVDQDLYHRLLEARGSNPDDLERGLGLRSRLSGRPDPGLRSRAEDECQRDPRVEAVRGTVVELGSGATSIPRLELEVEVNGQLLGVGVDLAAAEAERQS